jgi:hypothetical protein
VASPAFKAVKAHLADLGTNENPQVKAHFSCCPVSLRNAVSRSARGVSRSCRGARRRALPIGPAASEPPDTPLLYPATAWSLNKHY